MFKLYFFAVAFPSIYLLVVFEVSPFLLGQRTGFYKVV